MAKIVRKENSVEYFQREENGVLMATITQPYSGAIAVDVDSSVHGVFRRVFQSKIKFKPDKTRETEIEGIVNYAIVSGEVVDKDRV